MPTRESPQRLGELFRPWHCGALDEHRNDTNVALDPRRYLESYEVLGVVEPPGSLRVATVEPLVTDQGDEYIAGPDRLVDVLDEVGARLNRVDVHEDVRLSELGDESV